MIARKQLDLPPAVARAFVEDVAAYFVETTWHQRSEQDRITSARSAKLRWPGQVVKSGIPPP
jgi:hypothetical protein